MNTEKSIDILNSLIQINNDRIEGYETASKEADETDLKTLFSHFTETSLKCKAELVAEVKRLGGKPTEGTTTSGKLYRVWMDLKSAVTGSDRKAIINSCEYGEEAALETYKDAVSNSEDLSSEQLMMIKEQHAAIQANYQKIKNLSDLMA
ncbi:ferritin-like domain-containing protein [Flavobacterium caseinilyticum]|uniref:PA2169 family four-helix-bundle protein n=1 Tax=Flavobacterium caseinilyticum TaxID=2541732 RepID=A0A4R5AXP9_9FLAO|nr:PA2169 family four-helix-bundle protein [Flavobacterium caseinilyticum]TDD75462.1 PA2169 family four-helix-bundle protein [Flavobacterium caseinilyticum]